MIDPILQRASDGDDQAQRELVDSNAAALRRYLDRRMGNQLRRAVSAADLSQEVFTRVFLAMSSMPDGADQRTFRRWLYRNADWVLSNHGHAARRLQGESAVISSYQHAQPGGTHGDVTMRDEAAWLRALLRRLEPKYADVVKLRLDGLSFADIGTRLGITEVTARQRHGRILRILQEQHRSAD